MTSDKQQRLLSTFSADALSALAELTMRFEFKLVSAQISPPDMWITLKNRHGVDLTIDFEWGALISFIVSKKSRFNLRERHNLGPLVAARSGRGSVLFHEPFLDFERDRAAMIMRAAAKEVAELLPDVLAGDFSPFSTLRDQES